MTTYNVTGSGQNLEGSPLSDTFNISGTNHTIEGGPGVGSSAAGEGNDIYNISGSGHVIYAGDENDTFHISTASSLTIHSDDFYEDGKDYLQASNLSDSFVRLYGGNDTIGGISNFYNCEILLSDTDENDADLVGGGNSSVSLYDNTRLNTGFKNDIINITLLSNSEIESGDDDDFVHVTTVNQRMIILGGRGNDTISVDSDNDSISGSRSIRGEGGDDIITLGTVDHVVIYGEGDNPNGATGNDFITLLGASFTTVVGGYGLDTVTGGINSDTIYGDYTSESAIGGNDLLYGRGAADTIYGGMGDDIIYGDFTSADSLDGNDVLYGNVGEDTLYGNAGNDTLEGGAGADFLDGGNGIDTATYANSSMSVNINLATGLSTGGDATSDDHISIENLIGSIYNDTLAGTSGANLLFGGEGDDILTGGAGADTLDGGNGIDAASYAASTAAVNINLTSNSHAGGDAAGDSLLNIETLIGSAYNDTLTGSAANNYLYGGAGNDILDGVNGTESMYGGSGDDAYYTNGSTDQAFENLNEGNDTVYSTASHTLGDNVEALILIGTNDRTATGNGLDNYILGNTGANILNGLDGHDSLNGGDGNDTIYGGNGNDTLDGLTGSDVFYGGNGNDSYYLNGSTDQAFENLNEGNDTVYSTASHTLGDNVEALILIGTNDRTATGNGLDNYILGNTGANILNGLDGHDSLNGGDGNDTIYGGNGNDTLDGLTGSDIFYGGNGNDSYYLNGSTDQVNENLNEGIDTVYSTITYSLGSNVENLIFTGISDRNGNGNALNNILTGNTGNNQLAGGGGNDTLTGGTGNDIFAFQASSGLDTITDFAGEGAAGGDVIRLLGTGYTSFSAIQAVTTYNTGANTATITLSAGNVITIQNINSNFIADDFTFS